jgi:aerobic-type carbon monoxide dehydrogenase small subunit (CoxS/CutS family)
MTRVEFSLNGAATVVEVEDDELLLDTLRDQRLTSVRYSCGIGVCGTCTVMINGRTASSCLQLTQMVKGRDVQTAESVLGDESSRHHAVLEAFVSARAFQCSYCIPSMALTVAAALEHDPEVTAEAIREQLGGNLCRCGSYPQILAAISALIQTREQQ